MEMAAELSANGRNAEALALAESIRDSQNAEIAEMQQLLTELGVLAVADGLGQREGLGVAAVRGQLGGHLHRAL
ncbi:DUF305 domain-containing protein, partial [Blastococcus sp. MG754427]|uniref:DUF305 domain-containing protein n=1 Tax=Blastococcus sp. MG754427 TaxID=2570318 RepID=UPI0027E04A63